MLRRSDDDVLVLEVIPFAPASGTAIEGISCSMTLLTNAHVLVVDAFLAEFVSSPGVLARAVEVSQ